MVRILHVLGGMNVGGIETFIMNLYRNIDRDKVQFDFLVHTKEKCVYDEEIMDLGGRIYSVKPRRQGILKNIRSLQRFFAEQGHYGIVHQHVSSLSYLEPLKYAKIHNVGVRICHTHSTREGGRRIHDLLHRINQELIETVATDYFACSRLALEHTFPPKVASRCRILRNGIEIDKFSYDVNVRKQKREELGITGELVIGHVGRFHSVKNHEFIIQVFSELTSLEPEARLILVGDGPLREKIEKQTSEMGLRERIHFLGLRSDVSELMQAMDVFLFPSTYEGLGIALVDAQAAGLKCLASKNVIPEDVKVTDLVEFIELSMGPSVWAKKILNGTNKRQPTESAIRKAGYDIKEIARELEEWYLAKHKLVRR